MDDTPPEVEERYRAVLMQRTGEERLIMGCAMRDTLGNSRWSGRAVGQADTVRKCKIKNSPRLSGLEQN